jgi:cis-L-3-hydroxyproline dehydratase
MDHALSGHHYAKSAVDVAAWDVFGQLTSQPVCALLGGRQQHRFRLYVAIPTSAPEVMRDHVQMYREKGIPRFQLKLGDAPAADARRAAAVTEACKDGDIVIGDANGGWCLRDAVLATRLMERLPQLFIEQPARPSRNAFTSGSARRCR